MLQIYHDHSGHVGWQKTYELLNRLCYWPNMFDDVVKYIQQCSQCQQNKPGNALPYGLLQPLKIPDRPWQSISMDFITNLPKSKGFDNLLTVTDRFTKMVHLLPTWSTATAKDIADLVIKHVIRLHGIPEDIVSDRDTKFVNNFWKAIMDTLNVKLNMSSTAHPETDGQSERTNRTVITMLRSYVNEKNNDWAQHIPIIIYVNKLNNHRPNSLHFIVIMVLTHALMDCLREIIRRKFLLLKNM